MYASLLIMDDLIRKQLERLPPQRIRSYLEQLYEQGVIGILPRGDTAYLTKELAAIMSNFPDRIPPSLHRIYKLAQQQRQQIHTAPSPAEDIHNPDYYEDLSFAQLKFMLKQRGIRGARNKKQAAQLLRT